MGLFDNLKAGAELAKKLGQLELYKELLDARQEALNLQEENMELKEKVRLLEEKQKVGETLQFNAQRGVYERRENNARMEYCQVCWDVDSRLTRVVYAGRGASDPFCQYCIRFRQMR